MDNLTIQNHLRGISGSGQLGSTPEIQPIKPLDFDKIQKPEGPGFGQLLSEEIDKVNTQLQTADTKMADLASGRSSNIHETLIAMQKADVSLKVLMEVRTKVIRAYEEIMRMQV